MKPLIGILVVGLAVVGLLLTTCNGPSTDSLTKTSSSAPVTEAQSSPSEPSPAPVHAPTPTEPVSADASVPAATPAPTAPTRPHKDAASTMPADPTAPSNPAFFVLPPLPTEVLPDDGLEAVLAVHPLDLEGGSGASSNLLILPTDSTEALHSQLRIALPDRNWLPTDFTRGQPASTINTPTAYGQRWGQVFGGVAYQERIRYDDWTDGGSSRYVVASKVVFLRDRPTSSFGSMVLNVGLGNDRFLPEAQFAQDEDGVNVFGSLGVRVLPPVNAIANWTGQDLALGFSIAPVRTWPFVITPAVVDVTGNAGDGARFSMSAGLSYNFR